MRKNPYQSLLEMCGITQAEFRRRSGLGRQTIVGLLSGQYPHVSKRMSIELGKICHEKGVNAQRFLSDIWDSRTLQQAYSIWQSGERNFYKDKYLIEPPQRWDKNTSPFDSYVQDTAGSRQRFCKEMKVDAASVRRYAEGMNVQMPKNIYDAFKDIDYKYVAYLIGLQFNWREEHT